MQGNTGRGGARRYWAFISYSWHDKTYATKLHRRLERFAIPKALRKEVARQWGLPAGRLRPIFRDDEEMSIAGELGSRLTQAIDESAAMLLLASAESAKSKYVDEEVAHFLATRGTERLIVVAIGGTADQMPTWPPALRALGPDLLWVDCRGRRELDRRGLVRVAAAILDVSFDALWQRHRRSLRRRVAVVAAAAIALIATFGGLVIQQQATQRLSEASQAAAAENQRLAEDSRKLSPEAQRSQFESYLVNERLALLKGLDPTAVASDVQLKIVRADDINHDGLLDYVVIDETPAMCGSGGCAYDIFVTDAPGRYTAALNLLGASNPQIRERDGELDVVTSGLFVGQVPIYTVYQLSGKAYERAEYHFCNGVAFDFCREPITFTAVGENSRLKVRPGTVPLALPEAGAPPALPTGSTAQPIVLGMSRDGQWALVGLWKGLSGFVPADAVS